MAELIVKEHSSGSKFKRWFLEGQLKEIAGPHAKERQHHTHPWWKVMCLTGVDYFSTLGYQPGIAFIAAGVLSPIATLVLVLLTLFGALPMYNRVAAESPHGDGSISMLEDLLSRWKGKMFVLALLGFVATSFIITITLSAADATAHIIENPYAPAFFQYHRIGVTLALIAALAIVFLKGFKEAIGIAVLLVGVFILLNLIVLGVGFYELIVNPQRLVDWKNTLLGNYGNPFIMIGTALFVFPKLALGLSGFETGVVVMPLVKGDPDDSFERPEGRIRNTRKLLTTAALIMSVLLIASSIVTTTLIPAEEFRPETEIAEAGKANGRALAYIAHEHLGNLFGTAYDLSTILILWFAGSSAMAGLLNIVPRYLPRYGTEYSDALPAAVWHGPELGQGDPSSRAGIHGDSVSRHGAFQGRRGRAGRRIRNRSPGPDDFGRHSRDPFGLGKGVDLLGFPVDLSHLPVHDRREHNRAARRDQNSLALYPGHPRHFADIEGLSHDRAPGR
jgi:hypothetical protein